jgi:hypothetical protein
MRCLYQKDERALPGNGPTNGTTTSLLDDDCPNYWFHDIEPSSCSYIQLALVTTDLCTTDFGYNGQNLHVYS